MKNIKLYYDSIDYEFDWDAKYEVDKIKPNCVPNDKGLTFGQYGFLISKQTGEKNYLEFQNEFRLIMTNSRKDRYVYVIEPQGVYTKLFDSLPELIPNEVFEDIKSGHAILCICYIQEGDHQDDFYDDVKNFLIQNSISKDNFVFVTNNPNIENIDGMHIFSIDYYYNHIATIYQNDWESGTVGRKIRINNPNKISYERKRDKYFLCFNRSPKLHRTLLLSYLLKENLLDKGSVSLGPLDKICTEENNLWVRSSRNRRTPIYTESVKKEIYSYWEKIKSLSPITVDMTGDEMVHGYESSWNVIDPNLYNNHYFSLVTSTSFDTPWFHPDEKFWKPLGQLHPFIWIGPAHSLENLHKLGFKSFSPFIDESYNEEEDCEKRMLMIVGEIKRLCAMSKDEIHEWYFSMYDILVYNWRRILYYNPNPFLKMYNKLSNLLEC